MIPKIIHYCWFGGNSLPQSAQKFIEGWKKKCPDYEIIQWNEKNFKISDTPKYVQQAYACKKWAFVTDYVRLKVVYDNGGIYLDTDVELKKNLDGLLKYEAFFGKEDAKHVATGLGFGAQKHNTILCELMKDYDNLNFINEKGEMDLLACPTRNKHVFDKYGVSDEDERQVLNGNILIMPTIYMCPLSYQTGKMRHSLKTISIHWFTASWKKEGEQDKHWKYVKKKNKEDRKDYIRHIPNRIGMKILGSEKYEKLKKKIKGG